LASASTDKQPKELKMRSLTKTMAVAAVAACAIAMPAAWAADDLNPDAFVKMCDTDKDGMVSKAE
jgi:hypothetical protein